MKNEANNLYISQGAEEDDEIEILEVVGLDEDSPAAGRTGEEDPTEEESNEVTLDFDGGSEPDENGVTDRERLVRLRADFENFKKRVERERDASRRHASAGLVSRLLPVLDNFERAFSSELPSEDGRAFQQGVALIFRQLLDELRRDGLVSVDSLGQIFDPRLHEAVDTVRMQGMPENTVVEEIRRGYLLHDRLLRPAQVRVCVGGGDPADSSETDGES